MKKLLCLLALFACFQMQTYACYDQVANLDVGGGQVLIGCDYQAACVDGVVYNLQYASTQSYCLYADEQWGYAYDMSLPMSYVRVHRNSVVVHIPVCNYARSNLPPNYANIRSRLKA